MIMLIILEYAILASTFTLAKKAVMYAAPCFLIGFRMTLSGIVLLMYRACLRFFGPVSQKNKLHINQSDYGTFFMVSLFHIYLAFLFEFWSLQYLSSAKTAIIYATTPFFAALFSYILRGQKLSLNKVFAIIVGFAGLMAILSHHELSEGIESLFSMSLPELALLLSVASACYAWFLIGDLMKKEYHLVLINGVAMLTGGVLSLITSRLTEGPCMMQVKDWPLFLQWVGLLIIVANLISYQLYGWLLTRYSITFMTFAGFLCPLFGTLFGWFFLSEQLSWHHLLALVLITSGLVLFYREERSKK